MVSPSVKPHRLALILVVAAVAAAILALGAAAERQHRQTIQAEASRLATIAQVVDEHMRGVLIVTDNLLKQVISELDRVDSAQPEIRRSERERIIAEARQFLPGAGDIFLLDAQGDISYTTLRVGHVNFADRQYFRELKAGHDGLHIGRAIHGSPLPGVHFTAARALRDPDGVFHGAIVAAIDIAFAKNFYESLDIRDEEGNIGVYRMDGEGVVRHPFDERFLTTVIPRELNAGFQAGSTHITFRTSPIDGVERLITYREIAGFPLYVVVGKTAASILVKWRRDLWDMASVGGLFLVVIAVLAATMLRGFRREEAVTEALRRSNDRINLALRMVPVTLAEMDRDLRYTWVANPAAPLRPEDFIGKTDSQVFNDTSPGVEAARRDVLRSGRPRHLEVPFRTAGHARYLDFLIEPQRSGRGGIIGLRSAMTDVTERTEEKKALLNAKAAADQASQAKSRFLAAASHDLRQPLQALRLFLDVLAGQLAGSPQHGILQRAREAMTNAERLMAALLDMSRLEADLVKPEITAVPVADLAVPVVRDCAAQAAEKSLKLRWHACDRLVMTDVVLFQCILRNLVVNAVRYTGRGGILVGCRRRGETLRIEVWDTGSGIPADRLELIFEEFYRMPESETMHGHGLGFGLSIVERTARLLGHPIEVRSHPGRGTVFSVTVPLAAPDVTAAAACAVLHQNPRHEA